VDIHFVLPFESTPPGSLRPPKEPVDKIVERLALLKIILAEGPLQQFERTLSLWLKKDVNVLREAASKLGLDVEQWPQSERYSRVLLARELIKADGPRVLNALRVLTLHLNKDSLFGMIRS